MNIEKQRVSQEDARKRLVEMNLLDDFLFGTMMSYPGIAEKFSRILLKIITGKDIEELRVVPQKIYYGSDTDCHGIRMDVYLEEAEQNGTKEDILSMDAGRISTTEAELEPDTVYDIEPDQNDKHRNIRQLPRRVRFYHSKADGKCLQAGEEYGKLKNVVIIMITPYDPFGYRRMVYTVQNKCLEQPDMPYEDGAKTLFLYTKGTVGNLEKKLVDLLYYFEHTNDQNASNAELKVIQDMVEQVKRDEEVSVKYMKIFEREQMLIEQGREEVIAEEHRKTLEAERRAEEEKQRADAAMRELKTLKMKLKKLEESKSYK
ncbi:MAG: hypothetical protein PHE02_12820 [Lachnospiraceae bacterium]|nr:hypothetical protein [Lachnospiraceae bacterium]